MGGTSRRPSVPISRDRVQGPGLAEYNLASQGLHFNTAHKHQLANFSVIPGAEFDSGLECKTVQIWIFMRNNDYELRHMKTGEIVPQNRDKKY